MTEENDPAIGVDMLMSRIKAAAGPRGGDAASLAFSSVEELLIVAEARTAIRTRLPFRLPVVERIVLGILALVSRDQRRVNLALIAALRASVAANRDLVERVRALESERPR